MNVGVLIAHVSGIPIEELAPLAGGAGGLVFVRAMVIRAWTQLRIRERIRR